MAPGNFRPISISSVVLRQFKKILANRVIRLYNFDERQSVYQLVDGVGRSVAVLSAIIERSDVRVNILLA